MKALEDIEALLRDQGATPPVEKWHPDLSGDIDIVIRSDGSWVHEGGEIRRQELVNLFASILRMEADGNYYLVTPVEKWRLRVEDLPLTIIDMEISTDSPPGVAFKTNTGRWYELDGKHPLSVSLVDGEPKPALLTERGLTARINRACFYRLVELAEERQGQLVLSSRGGDFTLGAIA